jgi:ABC-type multidrug transport system fused ATPase/permease subunit
VRDLVRELRDILEPSTRRRLLVAMVGSVVIAMLDTFAIGLVLPLVDVATGEGVDSGTAGYVADLLGTDDPQRVTAILAVVVVLLFIGKNVGALIFNYWLLGFTYFERVNTSARILRFYLSAPYTEVSRRSGAELMRTMDTAVLQVFTMTINGLMSGFAAVVAIAAVVVALLIVAPLPTLALVAYFGAASLLYLRFAKPRAAAAGQVMNEASMAGFKAAFSALGALKEVNLRGSQQKFVEAFRQPQLRGSEAGRTAAFLGSLPRYILEVLFIIAIGLVLLIGAADGSAGTSGALGVLAVFVAAGFRLLPSISSLVASSSNVRVGAASVAIVRAEVLRAREFSVDDGPPPARLPFERELRLDAITFRYPSSEVDVLRDVDLAMPFGGTLAIVGGSGAGKTTMVDIILGLHQPTRGAVLVDGVDIAEHQASWRQNLGYVPQDTYILDATLMENVAFDVAAEDVDRDAVIRALDRAQLSELVAALPDGLDAQVGERGTLLSGGQRQRLGIARALYRNPRLLVLDEATSALDNETEHQIGQAIDALAGSISVIVVAHRLSTVRHVDRIVFLKEGRIASSGTFDILREIDADFARLVQLGSLDADPAR